MLEGNLSGAQHLGIPVLDLGRVKAWYCETLGFRAIHEPELVTEAGTIHAAFLALGDLTLELYQLVGADWEELRTRGHGHIDHLAIDVLDLDQAVHTALRAGAVLDSSTPDGPLPLPTFWPKGAEYVFLAGPSGEKVELNQRLDLSPSRRPENLGGWSHLGIPVSDLARTQAFYRRFGFQDVMRADIPEESIQVCMMEHHGFVVEFYQLPPGEALAEIRARRDGHIDHIALDVIDVDRAFEEVRAAGIEPLEEAPVFLPFWDKGAKYFNVRGPDGEKLEFDERIR
jgi:catechol 2,3-dioxygenase-like lactoylglutathione lyase family enzyme